VGVGGRNHPQGCLGPKKKNKPTKTKQEKKHNLQNPKAKKKKKQKMGGQKKILKHPTEENKKEKIQEGEMGKSGGEKKQEARTKGGQ